MRAATAQCQTRASTGGAEGVPAAGREPPPLGANEQKKQIDIVDLVTVSGTKEHKTPSVLANLPLTALRVPPTLAPSALRVRTPRRGSEEMHKHVPISRDSREAPKPKKQKTRTRNSCCCAGGAESATSGASSKNASSSSCDALASSPSGPHAPSAEAAVYNEEAEACPTNSAVMQL